MNAKIMALLHDHAGNLTNLMETIPDEQQFFMAADIFSMDGIGWRSHTLCSAALCSAEPEPLYQFDLRWLAS